LVTKTRLFFPFMGTPAQFGQLAAADGIPPHCRLHDFRTAKPQLKTGVSIQIVFGEAPKVWCFKNLGSQGWLLRAPGWIHAFLETPRLWGGLC
jgi:hypothetical protein